MLKERKIIITLAWLTLLTTILFGLLAGMPFLSFSPVDKERFYFSMLIISLSTFIYWVLNISLLLLSTRIKFLQKLLLRGFISIAIGILISSLIFHYTQKTLPPPQMRFVNRGMPASDSLKTPEFFNGPMVKEMTEAMLRVENGKAVELKMPGRKNNFFFFPSLLHSLTINSIILILCELVFLYYKKETIERENVKLRQTNIEAKNNQLKMQLQPHFLFNSLNTLRLLLHQNAADAENYLLKLSAILRFSTKSAFETVTDVTEELKLCITYLEMQQVRFGSMLQFAISNKKLYTISGKLPVYSLQLLVENAIKHNALTNENPLQIFIDYDESENEITVRNKLNPKKIREATSKVGLVNLSERYWLLSHEKIRINESKDEFAVSIKILY